MAKQTTKAKLPDGIERTDLDRPAWDDKRDKLVVTWGDEREAPVDRFELWHTSGFGWCIPTLHIANPSRRARTAGVQDSRTYAVTLDGKVVRIGMGPHVTERVTVYIRKRRLSALQRFIDLMVKGQGDAQEVRDRISTRRAQGVLHRAAGKTSWRW